MAAASDDEAAILLRPERRLKRTRDEAGAELERDLRPDVSYLGGLENIEQIEANAKYLQGRAQELYDQVQALTQERDRLSGETRGLESRRGELDLRVAALARESEERAAEIARLTEANAGLARQITERGEEIAQLNSTVVSTRTQLQTVRDNLALERTAAAAIGERSESALRTLDAFSFLIGNSPLIQNLPFAIVQSWNLIVQGRPGATSVAEVIQPVYNGLRVEAQELTQVLQLANVIEDVNLDGDVPRYELRSPDRLVYVRETLQAISAMLEGWRGDRGTLAKVVAELDTVRARLRSCAERAGFEGSPDALLEAGNADFLRRVRDCASVPEGLLEAYLRTATMSAG